MDITLALDLPQVLNLLLAVVFPVLVGLVTTKVTRSWVKAVLLATIALLSGLVTALLAAVLAGASFDLIGALLTGLAAWIIAIATHLGFWKPSGVTEKVQAVGSPPARVITFKSPQGLPGTNAVPTDEAVINVVLDEGTDPEQIQQLAFDQLRRDLRGD